jgi:peptidoglycan LD-endopeptidase CwlK
MNLEEALKGLEVPDEIREELVVITVPYISFEGTSNEGQVVAHKKVLEELKEIFSELHALGFPIHRITPISAYGWDDEASMAANNTSAFNYRLIYGTQELSNHARGLAVDINPLINPYTARDLSIHPEGAEYIPARPGTFTAESAAVNAFLSRGWKWGGDWPVKDWHHFYKV